MDDGTFLFQVKGAGAITLTEARRFTGEVFRYGEYDFVVEETEAKNRLRFLMRSVLKPEAQRVLECPRHIPPDDINEFKERVLIKENSGWENALELVEAHYSSTFKGERGD